MSSYKELPPANLAQGQIKVDDKSKPSKRPYWIGFIVFVILAIGLLFFVLWWFVWRDTPSPLITACENSQQCAPNEFCNNKVCNAVQCLNQSDCDKVANGNNGTRCVGSVGNIKGYCQTATCETNTDCADFGDNYICSIFEADRATPWIFSACVQAGQSCKSDRDCFGGNSGLQCIIPDGEGSGVCQQCQDNGDCPNPNGGNWVCNSSGVCTECTGNSACTDGSPNSDNWTCNNGSCCDNPQYTVNNTNGEMNNSCSQGELFDLCAKDGDCKSGNCIDLGASSGGVNTFICGGGANGKMTFSAGVTISDGVGDPSTYGQYICTGPVGPDDTGSQPFAVDGRCEIYSAVGGLRATGGPCGPPSFCRDQAAHSGNLLCTGDVTFENPFVTVCTDNDDCSSIGSNWGCGTDGLCGTGCNDASDCPFGFACNQTDNPPGSFYGVCTNPTTQLTCSTTSCPSPNAQGCECPRGYACSSTKGNKPFCAWAPDDSDSPPPPPPPLIVTSICTRPATALPPVDPNNPQAGSVAFIPAYCVNGFCNTNPGWINSLCVTDDDCTFFQEDPSKGTRSSLLCTEDGTGFNVCTGQFN